MAPERRSFLAQAWNWLLMATAGVLTYPLFSFLGYRVQRQPRRIMVPKAIPLSGFIQEHDFVLFAGEHGPWAVSRICTHLGCRLNYLDKEGQLVCPCHQSKFTPDGKRIDGPARRDLTIYAVEGRPAADGAGYVVII